MLMNIESHGDTHNLLSTATVVESLPSLGKEKCFEMTTFWQSSMVGYPIRLL